MEKKEYITPTMEICEVVKGDLICASPSPYSGPLDSKIGYFDEDDNNYDIDW